MEFLKVPDSVECLKGTTSVEYKAPDSCQVYGEQHSVTLGGRVVSSATSSRRAWLRAKEVSSEGNDAVV